ncbi:nucleoside deaminase [Neobacillus sp. FSL H8-0543]|uniref:nucleoside deaminase n=1 Tax=Neobacillus sp. FSL H8-0543 TaxID=2954672 RepID=UPI003158C972
MKWSDIPYIWQECFKEAWESFQEGSRPIGAVILNEQGDIVARGKSATLKELSDSVISHNELAHAEINALLKLDNRIHKKVTSYVLYTSLEPCPLCFGAFYMSGIRNLEYAATDRYGGSTNIQDTTPYLSRKPIKVNGPIPILEDLSVLLNVYFDSMIDFKKAIPVHEEMAKDYPEIVALAKDWTRQEKLKEYHHLQIQDVFSMMIDSIN